MASFYAELHVAGQRYPVGHCSYGFTQATDGRGRVSAKVRSGLLHLTLDVPDDQVLLDWAATPYKPLAGRIVFFDTRGGAARETLSWEAGECVGYREEFVAGSSSEGAYVCHLTITAPALSMQAGGGTAYVPPAARDHGVPTLAAAIANTNINALPARHFRKSDSNASDPDPVRTLFGPGRLSHPEEWNATIALLRREGVDVSYRPGAMGYWAVPDTPGRMLLDPEMSISALRHETRHFLDDKALGYPGMGYFFQQSGRALAI